MMTSQIKDVMRQCVGALPARVRHALDRALDAGRPSPSGLPAKRRPVVDRLIEDAIRHSNTGNFPDGIRALREACKIDPGDPRIAPHLGRLQFLQSRAVDPQAATECHDLVVATQSMNLELSKKSIYVPSDFWEAHGKYHVELLKRYGIQNFKRTVSHNYQNWLMVSWQDPQVKTLLAAWASQFDPQPWLNSIEVPDNVGFHLSHTFDDPVYALADAEQREVYRVAVGLLWESVRTSDSEGYLESLEESEIGNPIRIWRKGKRISSDLAHSIRERNLLLRAVSLRGDEGAVVGELGAGHGRLAEIFGKTTNYRYFIFDIPPALYVSQWYIKRLFPAERVFHFRPFNSYQEIAAELGSCRFAFFSANQLEMLPDQTLDLFVNMNSLMEMRRDQIRNFLHQIDRVTRRGFLSRQWQKWTNPIDMQLVEKDDFVIGQNWNLVLDAIDDIHPGFFNQVWSR